MLEVQHPSFPSLDENLDDGNLTQRRVRHINTIQVRNLTPFPVRDAFASALAQPSEQSQFNTHGHLSDDLDVTLSRRRSRRISVNSLWSVRSEEGSGEDWPRATGSPEMRGRRRAGSRVSLSGVTSLGAGASASGSSVSLGRPASAVPTVRASNRHRTTSIVSPGNSPFVGPGSVAPSAISASIGPFSLLSLDNSQTSLEKVIRSRLVETFIAITVPPISTSQENAPHARSLSATLPHRSVSPLMPSTPPKSAPATKDRTIPPRGTSAASNGTASRPTLKSSPLKPMAKSASSIRRDPPVASKVNSPKPISSPQKSLPKSFPRLNGKRSASSIVTRPSSTASPPASPKPKVQDLPPSPPPSLPSTPDFLSAIHRPSTNPSFTLDAGSGYEFAEWTDLGAHKLKIELWGRVGVGWRGGSSSKIDGKGKEKELDAPDNDGEWTILEEWNVNLGDLVLLPDDLPSNTSSLPSNTLLITLSPPGQTFYLPPPHPPTRTPSPSAGYASDPESEMRRVKQVEEMTLSSPTSQLSNNEDASVYVRRRHRGNGRRIEKDNEPFMTAGWKDLFNLVTLRSCILDNQSSLSEVVSEIDKIIKEDLISGLKREVSEREMRVEEYRGNIDNVRSASDELRDQIQCRREQLEERKQLLILAREQDDHEVSEGIEREEEVSNARDRLRSLRANLPPTRTTLLTTLSTIFPIDLLSPPDLLYTILDVPLPIPLTSSDPAPPLTLASHKEVTEDAVATALGFVAQVVQMLAAYLGKGLVYPVTCVGSRSLIRDGISAMVGPRMFPLYSKGVETYRFEYGVFLLNKDIEMLMADRDLHAMDMRHTLPNVKNLLLTLTNGEGAPLRNTLRSLLSASVDSLVSLPADVQSTSVATAHTQGTPVGSPSVSEVDLPPESNTPPESGSITPTATMTDSSRKSRAFLGLAGFLKGRYPSSASWTTSVTVKPVTESVEVGNGDDEGSRTVSHEAGDESDERDENDEEDRRTIRGVVIGEDREEEDKKVMGANGHVGVRERREKLGDDVLPHAPPVLVAQVNTR